MSSVSSPNIQPAGGEFRQQAVCYVAYIATSLVSNLGRLEFLIDESSVVVLFGRVSVDAYVDAQIKVLSERFGSAPHVSRFDDLGCHVVEWWSPTSDTRYYLRVVAVPQLVYLPI